MLRQVTTVASLLVALSGCSLIGMAGATSALSTPKARSPETSSVAPAKAQAPTARQDAPPPSDEDRDLREAFSRQARAVQFDLLAMAKVSEALARPELIEMDRLTPKRLDTLVANGEKLAELAASCEGKYKGKTIPSFENADSHLHPTQACALATTWKTGLRQYTQLAMAREAKLQAASFKHVLGELEAKGLLFGDDRDKLVDPALTRKPYEASFAKLGVELPSDTFAEVDALAKQYADVAKKASAVDRWPAVSTHRDGSLDKLFAEVIRAKGFKMVKIGFAHPDWTIEKDDGVILRKYRTATVTVKGKDTECRIYEFNASSQYAGGGTYTQPESTFEPERAYLVTRCP